MSARIISKEVLFIIPARGGSKGVPGKNIKPLAGKPLICYAIDAARQLTDDSNICLTTDSPEIIECAEKYGLPVPFLRPESLSTDTSSTYEVLTNALDFYEQQNRHYPIAILLQPTSPFRTARHIKEAFELYTDDIDMVVSVTESSANPYYTMFEEDENGYLQKVKDGNFENRQSCPKVFTYNGAVYVINTASLREKSMNRFKKAIKYTMKEIESIDIDTMLDWQWAEFIIEEKLI